MNDQVREPQNILRFSVGGRGIYGINVLKIREIVPYRKLNRLPGSNCAIAGVIELRGKTFQVIDLAQVLGLPSLADEHAGSASIIVTEFNRTMQGLLVSQVDKIMAIAWNDVKALPRATGANHYLSGVINRDTDLIGIVDVEKVLYELDPAVDKPEKKQAISSLTHAKGKKVLAVDDSRIARAMLTKTLEQTGIDYIMASSASEALDIVSQKDTVIDMVISDIEMPVMDGYALTSKLRTMPHTKDCYILLHSSLSGNACQSMSQQAGANAFLTKFEQTELIDAISIGLT